MEVYRLSRQKYANELSGKGAALRGARWNSKGTEIIYTAQNRSLAMAEVAVHFSLGSIPYDYIMMTIYVPDSLIVSTINFAQLPERWFKFPQSGSTQQVGDQFIKSNEYPLLKVPSVVTKGDFNYLINPLHSDFRKIRIIDKETFPFDGRLLN